MTWHLEKEPSIWGSHHDSLYLKLLIKKEEMYILLLQVAAEGDRGVLSWHLEIRRISQPSVHFAFTLFLPHTTDVELSGEHACECSPSAAQNTEMPKCHT